MTTTVLATALPHSLADDAPFQLTVFVTHKLVDGPADAVLSDFPAAADWVTTLAGCTLTLTTSLDPNAAFRCASSPTPTPPPGPRCCHRPSPVQAFPTPALSGETWRSNPASRMSDHAVDLHVAAITAAPTRRPGLAGDPVAGGLLETFANLDQGGPAAPAARGRAPPRSSRPAGAGAAAAGRADDDRTAHASRTRPTRSAVTAGRCRHCRRTSRGSSTSRRRSRCCSTTLTRTFG